MINSNIHDLVNYLPIVNGLPDLQFSSVYEEISKLNTMAVLQVDPETEFLDKLSYSYYDTYELWWAIGLYNKIISPLEVLPNEIKIPDRLELEELLRKLRS